jgi:phage terminase Nu1 subunit (DNA packaging protein)
LIASCVAFEIRRIIGNRTESLRHCRELRDRTNQSPLMRRPQSPIFEEISDIGIRGSVWGRQTMNSTSVTLSEIATHFGISRTAVRDLEIQHIINRADGIDGCRIRYIQHLRTRRSSAADDRLRIARAKAIELRTQRETHELVSADEALAVVDAAIGKLVAHLAMVPARCTRDQTFRKTIESEIDCARAAAADECERQALSLEKTGKAALP